MKDNYIPLKKVDFNILKKLESEDLITIKETTDGINTLYICNYTEVCAYSRSWNQYTIQCRGLIINKDGEVIARPFPKFFNHDEQEAIIPDGEDYVISYKEDGSCGILYWFNGIPKIATRGSFQSEQAIKATELLHTKYKSFLDKLDKNFTYIFEIIYPENKIVLDYGDKEDLILLGKIHTETGEDHSLNIEQDIFPTRRIFNSSFKNLLDLKNVTEKNIEGFVIHYTKSNFRIKVKMEEYKRLHKIMTGLSEKGIWEMLRKKEDLSVFLTNVPDEFFEWFTSVKNNLENKFKELEEQARKVYLEVKDNQKYPDRKSKAIYIMNNAKNIASIVFNMLDNGIYDDNIWLMIKPSGMKNFQENKDV